MILPDKVYNVLKWTVMIALPAFGTLYFTLAGIWGLPYADQIVKTIVALITFGGTTLGISTLSYNAQRDKLIQQSQNPYLDQ